MVNNEKRSFSKGFFWLLFLQKKATVSEGKALTNWHLSQRLESFFGGKYPNEDELEFMLRESKRMKKILSDLQFSWNSYIPLFHGGFALYYEKIEHPNERDKVTELSTKLVSFAMDISKMSKFLMCRSVLSQSNSGNGEPTRCE